MFQTLALSILLFFPPSPVADGGCLTIVSDTGESLHFGPPPTEGMSVEPAKYVPTPLEPKCNTCLGGASCVVGPPGNRQLDCCKSLSTYRDCTKCSICTISPMEPHN
jgi:hypothetical protein